MSKGIKKITANGRSKQPTNTLRKTTKGLQGDGAKQPKSMLNLILNLLDRKQGASLAEIQSASGWQAHSVRGFLSGTVKKRLGLKLRSSKVKDGERRYAIAG